MRPGTNDSKPDDEPINGETKAEDEKPAEEKPADELPPAAADAPPAEVSKTWRESAGREGGREGYVFGDVTRGAIVRLWGKKEDQTEEEKAIEAAGDEQYSHVQALVRDAVHIFRARGYTGTINMSHTVAHFTESCSVRVDGPKDNVPPWEPHAETSEFALSAEAASTAMGEHGRAGKVFATLLMRLERRAASWKAISGGESLDPNLTSSAQIGFRMPIVNLGWGVSVSLTVTTSSLLRYAEYATTLADCAPSA